MFTVYSKPKYGISCENKVSRLGPWLYVDGGAHPNQAYRIVTPTKEVMFTQRERESLSVGHNLSIGVSGC